MFDQPDSVGIGVSILLINSVDGAFNNFNGLTEAFSRGAVLHHYARANVIAGHIGKEFKLGNAASCCTQHQYQYTQESCESNVTIDQRSAQHWLIDITNKRFKTRRNRPLVTGDNAHYARRFLAKF